MLPYILVWEIRTTLDNDHWLWRESGQCNDTGHVPRSGEGPPICQDILPGSRAKISNKVVTMLEEQKDSLKKRNETLYFNSTQQGSSQCFHQFASFWSCASERSGLGSKWMVITSETWSWSRWIRDARFQPRNAITSTLRSMTGNRNGHAQYLEAHCPLWVPTKPKSSLLWL